MFQKSDVVIGRELNIHCCRKLRAYERPSRRVFGQKKSPDNFRVAEKDAYTEQNTVICQRT